MTDAEFAAEITKLRKDVASMRAFLKIPGHLDRLFDLAIVGAGKPKREPRRKARTALPAAFPDQAQIDRAKGFWAQAKRHDLVVTAQAQAEGFRDYHIGRGTLAADWPATWGTWMRNALRINKAPWGQQTVQDQPVGVEVWRWRVNAFHNGDDEQAIRAGYWKADWGPKPGEPGCRAPN